MTTVYLSADPQILAKQLPSCRATSRICSCAAGCGTGAMQLFSYARATWHFGHCLSHRSYRSWNTAEPESGPYTGLVGLITTQSENIDVVALVRGESFPLWVRKRGASGRESRWGRKTHIAAAPLN